jgi:hypothetical protein
MIDGNELLEFQRFALHISCQDVGPGQDKKKLGLRPSRDRISHAIIIMSPKRQNPAKSTDSIEEEKQLLNGKRQDKLSHGLPLCY